MTIFKHSKRGIFMLASVICLLFAGFAFAAATPSFTVTNSDGTTKSYGTVDGMTAEVDTTKVKSIVVTGDISVDDLGKISKLVKSCTELVTLDMGGATVPAKTTLPSDFMTGHTKVAEVALPAGVTTIGAIFTPTTEEPEGPTSGAFSGCTALTTVSFPQGLVTIGDYSFSGCTALTTDVLPGTVETISAGAFKGDKNLKLSELPSSLKSLGAAVFQDCAGITVSALPTGVTKVLGSTFQGCTAMSMMIIANPSNVQMDIATDAFVGCTNLKTVYSTATNSTKTRPGKDAFSSTVNVLYVPNDSVPKYMDNAEWKDSGIDPIKFKGMTSIDQFPTSSIPTTVTIGTPYTATVAVTPATVPFVWTTGDESVATVKATAVGANSAVITGIKKGIAKIYATTYNADGAPKVATYDVTVTEGIIPPPPVSDDVAEVVTLATSADLNAVAALSGDLATKPSGYVLAASGDIAVDKVTGAVSSFSVSKAVTQGAAVVVGTLHFPLASADAGLTLDQIKAKYSVEKQFGGTYKVDLLEAFPALFRLTSDGKLELTAEVVVIDDVAPASATYKLGANNEYGLYSVNNVLYIYDGAKDGMAADPIAVVAKTTPPPTPGSSSSSSCNAGFAASALLLLAPFGLAFLRRKK